VCRGRGCDEWWGKGGENVGGEVVGMGKMGFSVCFKGKADTQNDQMDIQEASPMSNTYVRV